MPRFSWAGWTAFIARRPGAILAAGGVLTAHSAQAAWQLQTNGQFVDYFDPSVEFRRDTDFMMEHLSGIYVLDYQLFAKEAGGIAEPDYLVVVDQFAQWLRQQNGVTHVRSIADIHKRVHQHLVAPEEGARAEDDALPTERPAAAQGLLLYEMSLPEGRDLTEQVARDKKSTRVTVLLKNITSRELIDLAAASKRWLEQHAPAHMHTEARAPVVIFANLSQRNTRSMMGGNLITLLLISLSLVLTLKSLKLGALSLLPNLMPLGLAYGTWHVVMGDINIIASVAGAICLGLIVDDTLHFLSKLRDAQRTLGHTTEAAIRFALEHAGRAMVVTSAILVVGFSILSQSRFKMNSFFGILVVFVVIAALLADLLVLPAALLVVDRLFGGPSRRPGASWPEDRVFIASPVNRSPIAPVPDVAPAVK